MQNEGRSTSHWPLFLGCLVLATIYGFANADRIKANFAGEPPRSRAIAGSELLGDDTIFGQLDYDVRLLREHGPNGETGCFVKGMVCNTHDSRALTIRLTEFALYEDEVKFFGAPMKIEFRKIQFADGRLKPGESKSFDFNCLLPDSLFDYPLDIRIAVTHSDSAMPPALKSGVSVGLRP